MNESEKEIALSVLELEATFLDDQRWDEWLDLYLPECEYWVPTWRTEDEMTADPRAELSHIYYASREGLEDRIVRIRSGRSPASSPMRRTTHILGPVLVTDRPADDAMGVRASWTCHVFDPRHKESFTLFGLAHYRLRKQGEKWRIEKKKTIVQNDYFPSVVDIYCL